MQPDWFVGPVSVSLAKILSICAGAYTLATVGYVRDAFRERLPDRWSAASVLAVMLGLTVILWTDGARLVPAPYSYVVLGAVFAGALITLGYTASDAHQRLERMREDLRSSLDSWTERLPAERKEALDSMRKRLAFGAEDKRKTPHLLMVVFLLVYGVLGWLLLKAIATGVPLGAGEGSINLHAALDAGRILSGHIVGLTMLLGLLFLVAPVEIIRLRYPDLTYPFKGTITSLLRARETGLFGAHYYIAASLPLASMVLMLSPVDGEHAVYAFMAILGVTILADAASALFGIRYGRRKLPHNPDKSYVGTVAGTLVAVLVAVPVVGVPMGLVSGLVFLLVDVLAPVPFSISDNILNPVALAVAYVLMDPWLMPLV